MHRGRLLLFLRPRLAVLPRLHRRHRHRQPLLLHPLLLPLRPRLRPPAELEAPRTSLLLLKLP